MQQQDVPNPQDMGAVRDAARSAVTTSSLRSVARDVGMSPSGLDRFIAGSHPYPGTARRLGEWYLRTMQARGERLHADTARQVLALLTEHLPASEREGAVQDVLTILRGRTARSGSPMPPWLDDT